MLALLLLPLLWAGSLQKDPRYQLQVPKSVTVQEGLCVLVPCSFSWSPWSWWSSPGELYMSWLRVRYDPTHGDRVATNNPRYRLQREIKDRFHLLGDMRTRNCSLSISGAKVEDAGSYVFRTETKSTEIHVYADDAVTLQVTALTEKPVVHIPEPLESGRPTRLSCSLPGSCQGGRPLTFSWSGDALNSAEPRTLRSSVLILTPRPQDHDTNLTCQVELGGSQVTTETTIQLNVSYAPRNLNISLSFRNGTVLQILQNASSLSILEGQALQLTCAVDSNPPAQLSWFWRYPDLKASLISNTGLLELPPGTAERGGFTCRAQNALGSHNASVSLSMLYAPQLLGPWCSWEAEGLRCSCSSRARPAPFLGWRLGEGPLEGNGSDSSFSVTSSAAGPWANSSLSLRGGPRSGLRLSCEAWNAHGTQRATVLLLPGKSEPQTGAVVGALGGAGAMALLSLCLCLIFFCIVKTRRTQAAKRSKRMDHEQPVMGTVPWGAQQKPWPDSSQSQAPPAGDALAHREQQELHYASLSFQETKFHEMKSQEPQDRESASSIEYSEIKASK